MRKYFLILFLLQISVVANIATTSPALTETMVALGLKDKLVAVSTFCNDFSHLPKVGTSLRPNFENLIKSKAKIVFIQKNNKNVLDKRFEKLGFKTYSFSFKKISDIKESIQNIANITNSDSSKIIKKIEIYEKKIKSLKLDGNVLAIIGLQKKLGKVTGFYIAGIDNHYNDLITLSGARNSSTLKGYHIINREQVLKMSIDRIWFFLPVGSEAYSFKNTLLSKKKVTVWKSLATQKVGVGLIDFMKEFYEKLSF